ncbi:hypothetical protein VOLCADRAFT_100610 [Volvox carteri f. nagariensis]|uniref:Uncharacterized protein n=1 Tax=Volvox carteri f. nagariensis TaxID=3068 RepID=D8UKM0_VOLCA|nr:uncharacterized protein VOLCADRAFT_100610 [Volvox carteri f. nagariensis]EFJ39724.1 hypothetical protein VOLCADRAFT_100610 [Volvox carteri f. nagariensis]|eukprot:XP_002959206.1 hypothetical protein VOLCADRAFT_100610 [Volvox carteri f. nagariensis]
MQLEGYHQDEDPSAADVRERWRRQKAAQRAAALPELRQLQRQQDAARHAAARAAPEVRAQQQVRAQEQLRDTAQHAGARSDPGVRAQQQQRNTVQHAAARADPEVRALQQQSNTAQHAAVRQMHQHDQQAAPRDTLLARMHRLLRFTDLHRDAAIDLPDFLLAIPEARVQDLPGGQLPPDRQVPYTVQLQCASTMAVALRRRMPSRVCAVCSEVCSEDQSTVLPWMEIPNVDILRADVMCTDAVQRWGRTLVWRRMARTAQGEAPPPPDPVLPARYRVSQAERVAAVDGDGAGRLVDDAAEGALEMGGDAPETGDLEAAAAEQEPPEQLPPDQQPRPPRVLPRACLDDPASVEVPYCMRLEADLPNRTMLVGDGVAERIFVCNTCHKALSARRVPEAALARLDPGDVPRVNHLGDPLPSPTFLEGQLLGRGRIIQQLLIMYLADRPPDVFPRAVKTHGIGVVNPDPNMLRAQLPARASDLAGAITVVCVDQVRNRAELLERVQKAPGLQHNDEEELAVDEDALQEYERMGCAAGVRQFQDVVEAAVRDGNLADATAAPDMDPAGPVQPTLADPTLDAGPVQPTLADPTPDAGPVQPTLADPTPDCSVRFWQARRLCSTLTHTHNDTCKRHGCRGTDDSCGMAFPRVLRSAFQWIGTGGLFLLPRLGPNIVLHVPAAALAFGCNQLFTLACEVDRVYTAEAAAQLARPEEQQGDCALLQPAADRARDSAYYSTKYTGKSINDSQAQLTCNALTRVQDFLLAGRMPNPGASGPTAFGNMCATVHRMTASITAGMALVAMKLDGHSTFEATFECAYLQVDAFTALSAGAEQSPEAATTAAVLVEAEEQEGYTVTNAVQSYMLRGEELSGLDCSVYNISSNYEVRRVPPAQHPHRERLGLQIPVAVRRPPAPPPEPPAPTAAATLDQPTSQTATELPRLVAFHGTHPLYRTHVHVRLPRPRYVQLGGSLPRRPRPGTSAAGMAQYYAFVLGTFKAHRGQPIPTGLTVKEAYDAWWAELGTTEAGRSYQVYVSVLLDNIEENHAGKARRQAEYNQRRRQQRAAAAAAALPEGDSTSASDGDADDGIRGHLRPDPETQPPAEDQLEHFVYIPGQEYPTAGTDLAAVALTDLFDCTNAAGMYAYDAARRCRAPALADGHGAGSDRFSRRITPADLPLLTEATKRLKRYLVAAAAGTVEADGGAHAGLTATPEMDTPHVELHRPTSGPLVAIVRMPGTPERTEQVRMPIYVHLPQPPSIDDTIELFTLAPHQAVPFMLMARYFDRHDEPNPGDPLQMLVEGKPGTGKSQFVQALLWYTFQHGCPHWAATCAYSWAAATAFSTPVHRSLSTHAMFALSAGSNRADSVRKGSAASLQVHRNVGDGALIIDEIGMNSLDHLGACNQSCTRHLLPPPHLAGDHPAATIFSGRPSANTGDEFQHPKPGGPPLYRYAAAVECNPQFSPSVPTAQSLHGEEANDGDPNEAAAGSQGGQQQPEAAARRPRAVPQTQSCILEGFRVYRSLAKTVFLLEKQQRQDSSPSGRRLTEYASMFGGEPATEQRIAEMVDDLNSRAIVDLADLAHLEPRVVLQRNEPRHTLNTRLIMLEAQRKNQRLVVWNADHVPVQKRGAAVEPALTHRSGVMRASCVARRTVRRASGMASAIPGIRHPIRPAIIPIACMLQASEDGANVQPGMEQASEDGANVQPGMEQASEDGANVQPGMEVTAQQRLHDTAHGIA